MHTYTHTYVHSMTQSKPIRVKHIHSQGLNWLVMETRKRGKKFGPTKHFTNPRKVPQKTPIGVWKNKPFYFLLSPSAIKKKKKINQIFLFLQTYLFSSLQRCLTNHIDTLPSPVLYPPHPPPPPHTHTFLPTYQPTHSPTDPPTHPPTTHLPMPMCN